MKAARFHAREDLRIEDVPEPELRPGTVKIAVAWCGICGTDLHEFLEGPIFTPPPGNPHVLSHEAAPVTLGHQFSGTVEELGEGVTGLAVGDSVVVEPYIVCNECGPCVSGHYNLCTKLGFIGLAGGGGGLSEKIVVDVRWVHPVGDIPLDEAALIEPLAVAYHAVAAGADSKPGTSPSSAVPDLSDCSPRRSSKASASPRSSPNSQPPARTRPSRRASRTMSSTRAETTSRRGCWS